MSALCPTLGGVPEPNPPLVPARDPDRLIRWFIGVVVMGVVVNVLSGFVVAQNWAWLPPAVFIAALLVAVSSTGLLRRERYRTTRARDMTLLALTGYLAVTVWGSVTRWPLSVMILSVVCLMFGIAALPGGIAALLDDGPWWGRFYSARSQPCCWGSRSCWIDRH